MTDALYSFLPINPTIFNIIRWVAGSMERTTHRPIVSIIFFIISFRHSKLFIFIILKLWKIYWNEICKNFARNYEKINNTSDAWLMSRSSHRPSDPEYYIEDCRISWLCRLLEGQKPPIKFLRPRPTQKNSQIPTTNEFFQFQPFTKGKSTFFS